MAFDQSQYDLTANPFSGGGTYGEGKISDALQRVQGLKQALQSGQIDYNTYNNLFQQIMPQAMQAYQGIAGGGSHQATAAANAGGTTLADLSRTGGMDLNTFATQLKNLTGREPTSQDINNYFSNVAPQLNRNTNSADQNSLINQYLSTQYQPDIQKYQQQQQMDEGAKIQEQVQGLINKQTGQNVNYLTSPEVSEKIRASYNQGGVLNSGQYNQGIEGMLANAANLNTSNALGSVGIPEFQNMGNTFNAPYQGFLGNLNSNTQQAGQNQTSTTNFGLQSDLAKQIAGMQQPTNLQQWAPIISGALQGAGSAARKSAICLELLRQGLATWDEIDALHWKVLASMFTRCRALLFYSQNGDKLVKEANQRGFDWSEAKEWFIDEPLREKTSIGAVNRYSLACKRLALIVAPDLWDERTLKGSFLDFFRFIIPVMKVPGYRRCYKDLFKRTFLGLREAYNG